MKSRIIGVLLILVVIFSCFSLYSCEKNRDYDEAEVKSVALDLIKKSEKLNDLFYGDGMSFVDDETYAVGPYYPASNESLNIYGVETIDDIKRITEEVFSVEMSTVIYETKLSAVYDSDGVIRGYSRYYQKYTEDKNPKPVSIMVYKNAEVLLKDSVTYNYDTLKVIGAKGETVFVEIEVFVKTDDNKTQNKTLKIGLIEEERGWRLSTPTYTSYVDLDYYNQLQNKNQK